MIDRQAFFIPQPAPEPKQRRLRLVRPREHALSDFRRLQAFVVVAEELHFRRAAERLHMAQSPLSRTISSLESDLGFALFDRSRTPRRLRPAGSAFLIEVQRMLDEFTLNVDRIRSASAAH